MHDIDGQDGEDTLSRLPPVLNRVQDWFKTSGFTRILAFSRQVGKGLLASSLASPDSLVCTGASDGDACEVHRLVNDVHPYHLAVRAD